MRPITASAVGAEALPRPGRSVPGSGGGPPALGSEVARGKQAAIVARLATSAASRRGLVLFMVFAPCRGSFTTLPPVCGMVRALPPDAFQSQMQVELEATWERMTRMSSAALPAAAI